MAKNFIVVCVGDDGGLNLTSHATLDAARDQIERMIKAEADAVVHLIEGNEIAFRMGLTIDAPKRARKAKAEPGTPGVRLRKDGQPALKPGRRPKPVEANAAVETAE